MTISVQITIIGLGILLLAAVILAAIQKKISESHALLWIVPCILIILGGIFPQMTYRCLFFPDRISTGYHFCFCDHHLISDPLSML